MTKRKVLSHEGIAILMEHYGVTSYSDLRKHLNQEYGTTRRQFTCPRCSRFVEAEVNPDGSAVCPACENEVRI